MVSDIRPNSLQDRQAEPGAGSQQISPRRLDEILEHSERFLQSLDGSAAAAAETIRSLRSRLTAGRLHLAVLGQFKRGKSTLLNALVGEELLPSSVVPLTGVPTFLRSGDDLSLRVNYADGRPAESRQGGGIEELRSLDLAESELRRAVWLNPFEPNFAKHLAWCLYKRGAYGEARDWILRTRAMKSGDGERRELLRLIDARAEGRATGG